VVPKIGRCARLSLTVFKLEICRDDITNNVSVPSYDSYWFYVVTLVSRFTTFSP